MVDCSEVFVGMDVSKDRHAVAVAESGRDGEVRFFGEIGSDMASVRRFVRKVERPERRLRFCYEAGPTGYGLQRLIEELGHECAVIAPSLIPRRPGERVKTNRRDAVKLARLFRAGELTEIWTPDEAHEARRDLVRAREAAVKDRTRKRQESRSFLLRHGKIYPGKQAWCTKYFKWLHDLSFGWPAHKVVLHEMIVAETQCRERVARLDRAIEDALLDWSLAPVLERLQALRSVGLIAAVTFMVEVGNIRRLEHPRQLAAEAGLCLDFSAVQQTIGAGHCSSPGYFPEAAASSSTVGPN